MFESMLHLDRQLAPCEAHSEQLAFEKIIEHEREADRQGALDPNQRRALEQTACDAFPGCDIFQHLPNTSVAQQALRADARLLDLHAAPHDVAWVRHDLRQRPGDASREEEGAQGHVGGVRRATTILHRPLQGLEAAERHCTIWHHAQDGREKAPKEAAHALLRDDGLHASRIIQIPRRVAHMRGRARPEHVKGVGDRGRCRAGNPTSNSPGIRATVKRRWRALAEP
mmetsp:Transcript_81013/g.225455  ORF Transcript_81013/g.225455 Transcript_81013/m.225455 type:complete len:227 (+) Transcript_81013:962-1642(+)